MAGKSGVNIPVVFDCMLFLQAAARRNSPAGLCLLLAQSGLVDRGPK